MTPPVVMTIAGSDSSGSSGIQADLPTFAALGVHGTSVITVVTAQDTIGVRAFHPLPPDLVAEQLHCLLADLAPAATKTGLLLERTAVELVEQSAEELGALVVDPVMVNSRGDRIVAADVVDAYRRLAGVAAAVTPNRWELELLLGIAGPLDTVQSVEDRVGAIRGLGADLVVVTGGRGLDAAVVDVVVTPSEVITLTGRRVGTGPIRGTGCTFSAALAAALAHGRPPAVAAGDAHDFVQRQLLSSRGASGAGIAGVSHVHPG